MYCNGVLRGTITMNKFLLTAALSTLYLAAAVAQPARNAELYQSREDPDAGVRSPHFEHFKMSQTVR
ncbi:unnamed protein product [Ixodes pacificus]